MDVNEAKLAKEKAEIDLKIIIHKFEQETGFKVTSVKILRRNDIGTLTDLYAVKIAANISLDE